MFITTLEHLLDCRGECGIKNAVFHCASPAENNHFQSSLTLTLCLINRQMSSESSASGSVSSGKQVVYEAICGKTGGFDVTVLQMLRAALQSSGRREVMPFHTSASDYKQAQWTFPMEGG